MSYISSLFGFSARRIVLVVLTFVFHGAALAQEPQGPAAPTADAAGPYSFCPQTQPWFLDGT